MELTQNRVEGFEAFGECADVAVEVVLCLHVCSFDVVMFFLLRFGGSDQPRINSGSIQNTGRLQFVGVFLYGVIYAIFLSFTGQTPGKRAYKLKVVDLKTQKKLSFFRAFWRFVAFLFTATTFLGLLLPFYRKDKRALHDLLSSSVEIEVGA